MGYVHLRINVTSWSLWYNVDIEIQASGESLKFEWLAF